MTAIIYMDISVRGKAAIENGNFWQKVAGWWQKQISTLFARISVTEKEEGRDREEINAQAERMLDVYGNSILRLAYSYLHNYSDAEEVLQDTLIQFLRTAPQLSCGEHEKAWLLRVAANLSKNRIIYNKVRAVDELSETLVAEEREDLSFVWDAVKMLPAKYREVIHLYYEEGYATAEIAIILGRKESTIRSDLRRAREKLKSLLQREIEW